MGPLCDRVANGVAVELQLECGVEVEVEVWSDLFQHKFLKDAVQAHSFGACRGVAQKGTDNPQA